MIEIDISEDKFNRVNHSNNCGGTRSPQFDRWYPSAGEWKEEWDDPGDYKKVPAPPLQ